MIFHPKILLDTNIVVDYLNERDPFFDKACLLMLCTKLGEFESWITSSQATDIVYISSNGSESSTLITDVLYQFRSLRQFIEVHPTTVDEVDAMLQTTWNDPEDYLLYTSAKNIGADCIISRDSKDFEQSADIPVFDCDGFFDWLEREHGLVYDEIPI